MEELKRLSQNGIQEGMFPTLSQFLAEAYSSTRKLF
jgi:hypothetical protein